jgi:nucleoside-diphosphate-sugar epimerase
MKAVMVGAGNGLEQAVRAELLEHGSHVLLPDPGPGRRRSIDDVDLVIDVGEPVAANPSTSPGRGRVSRTATAQRLLRDFNRRTGRLVFVSSVLVYAPVPSPEQWPIQEHSPRMAHGDAASAAYGQDCIDAEDLIIREWGARERSYAIVRPTVLWGSATPNLSSMLVDAARRQPWQAARTYDVGVMQWLDVRDAARAVVLAATAATVDRDIFTLAGLDGFTAADVVASVWQEEDLLRDAEPLKFDTARAEVVLGWRPERRVGPQVAAAGRGPAWMGGQRRPGAPTRARAATWRNAARWSMG